MTSFTLPKAPVFGGWSLDAVNHDDETGHLCAARFINIDETMAVTSTVADGEFRVSVVALGNHRVLETDMRRIRANFDMADADEDTVQGWRFHAPPRMLRKAVGAVPEVVEEPEQRPSPKRALTLAFLRPQVMRDV